MRWCILAGSHVFVCDHDAFKYIMCIARRDLQYRGFREDRIACFDFKQQANFLLYERICACADAIELEVYRQSWDRTNRPQYALKKWSPEQLQVLEQVAAAVSHEDEEERRGSCRFLFVQGAPGSRKTTRYCWRPRCDRLARV